MIIVILRIWSHLLIYFNSIFFIIFINKNTIVHCLFMLVRSALIIIKNTHFDIKNVSVNVEINIQNNECCRSIVDC